MPSEASLANLKPAWKPGKSGNERGLNRQYQAMLRCGRINSLDMMQIAVQCARDTEAPWPARLTAIALVLDRSWGKPKEHLHLDGADGANILIVTGVPRNGEAVANETTIVTDETTYTITVPSSAVEDTSS